MNTVPMWREKMTNEYKVSVADDGVFIHLNSEDEDSFIDIYIDWYDIPSPFKTIDDAKIFAEAIVKLLKSVDVMVDKDDS